MRRVWLHLAILAIVLGIPWSETQAQSTRTVILGLQSAAGDDLVANALSEELRLRAGAVDGWSVGEQQVTLGQMILVHGCGEVDEACLKEIAGSLKTGQLLFGEVSRGTSAGGQPVFVVDVELFDAEQGKVLQQARVMLKVDDMPQSAFADAATELLAALGPRPEPGTLVVRASVEGARVWLDDRNLGVVQGGEIRVHEVVPGPHQLRVEAIGFGPFAEAVDIRPEETVTIMADLPPMAQAPVLAVVETETVQSVDPLTWIPYALFGVGAVGIGGLIASWVVIDNVGTNTTFKEYSSLVDTTLPEATDVCDEAEKGSLESEFGTRRLAYVADKCETALRFETLQYVFGGVAGASILTGVLLLALTGDESEDDAFALTPILKGGVQGLSATLRF